MSVADEARWAARLSILYIMTVATEVLRTAPVDVLDLLLLFTIANMNAAGSPIRPGAIAPAPIGVSRNAVSRALNIPLETVRRRVAGLIERKALAEQAGGLIFLPDNPLGLGGNEKMEAFNLEKLRELFRGLKTLGVALD